MNQTPSSMRPTVNWEGTPPGPRVPGVFVVNIGRGTAATRRVRVAPAPFAGDEDLDGEPQVRSAITRAQSTATTTRIWSNQALLVVALRAPATACIAAPYVGKLTLQRGSLAGAAPTLPAMRRPRRQPPAVFSQQRRARLSVFRRCRFRQTRDRLARRLHALASASHNL